MRPSLRREQEAIGFQRFALKSLPARTAKKKSEERERERKKRLHVRVSIAPASDVAAANVAT